MKKTKVIIPAMGLLLLSTAASITGTVAWFSVNTTVTANGMNVKAKAQDGITISNAAAGTYSYSATSTKTTCAALYPASSCDIKTPTFLTSVSTDPADPNTEQAYTAASAWVDNEHDAHYVVHNFYIRSSTPAALTVTSLNVKSVVSTNPNTQPLSKCLRVGVFFAGSNNQYIYAPIAGYTASYSVQKAAGDYSSDAEDRQSVSPIAGATKSSDTDITSIPAMSANGLAVSVYIWFEGEDDACISNNLPVEADQLGVTIQFSINNN